MLAHNFRDPSQEMDLNDPNRGRFIPPGSGSEPPPVSPFAHQVSQQSSQHSQHDLHQNYPPSDYHFNNSCTNEANLWGSGYNPPGMITQNHAPPSGIHPGAHMPTMTSNQA